MQYYFWIYYFLFWGEIWPGMFLWDSPSYKDYLIDIMPSEQAQGFYVSWTHL